MTRLVLLTALFALPALAERPRLVVLELGAGAGVDRQTAFALGDAITTLVASRGLFDVVSSRDIATLLGVERQKQLLGCDDASASCMAELSGALGARFVLSGSLAKLGDAWQLTLTTLDSARAQPIGRTTKLASSLEALQAQLPWAVAEATATPAPAEPSKALSVSLLVAGAAVLVGGGVVGLQGLTQEAALRQELDNPRPGALDTLPRYQQSAQQPGLLKTISLVTLLGGAALVGAAIITWPSSAGGTRLALVPTGNGAAVVGGFP